MRTGRGGGPAAPPSFGPGRGLRGARGDPRSRRPFCVRRGTGGPGWRRGGGRGGGAAACAAGGDPPSPPPALSSPSLPPEKPLFIVLRHDASLPSAAAAATWCGRTQPCGPASPAVLLPARRRGGTGSLGLGRGSDAEPARRCSGQRGSHAPRGAATLGRAWRARDLAPRPRHSGPSTGPQGAGPSPGGSFLAKGSGGARDWLPEMDRASGAPSRPLGFVKALAVLTGQKGTNLEHTPFPPGAS